MVKKEFTEMQYSQSDEKNLRSMFGGVLCSELEGMDENKAEAIRRQARINISRMKDTISENIFFNEYAILYSVVVLNKQSRINKDSLAQTIKAHAGEVLNSPRIIGEKFGAGTAEISDEEVLYNIIASTQKILAELSPLQVDEEEFNTACKSFMESYKQFRVREMANELNGVLDNPNELISVHPYNSTKTDIVTGADGALAYCKKAMRSIENATGGTKIKSTIIDKDWLREDGENEDHGDKETMCGTGIKEIDSALGELRRGNMLGVLGPPKGGKTRFSNYMAHLMLSKGYNVCVWPLEGTKEEWIANIVSCEVAKASMRESKDSIVTLDSKKVLQHKYNNGPENAGIVGRIYEAKVKISTSSEYGKLSFIEGTAFLEDFLDVLEDHYKNDNPYDVIIIDSLVNIMSNSARSKSDRISEAYMKMKSFITSGLNKQVLAIMPAQLKQTAIDALRGSKGSTIDVTAGGESAETIRTPDEVIGLFSSEEEKMASLTHMYHVASRHSGNFKDFTARSYLGCCLFMSKEDE